MASAFSHAVVALALGKVAMAKPMPTRFWLLSIVCSILPDADVIGFSLGIEYGHPLGHRGLSHSLSVAAALSLLVVQVGFPDEGRWSRRWWLLVTHFFLVTGSHGLLDAMTDGGLGVAFFAPFDNTRYFLPWRPIMVSPIGLAEFFDPQSIRVLINECIWIWVPAGLLALGVKAYRKGTGAKREAEAS
jgi:inner membrane protein